MNREDKEYRRVASKDADPRPDDSAWRRAHLIVTLKLHRIALLGADQGGKDGHVR
jgi:hypothetical protein